METLSTSKNESWLPWFLRGILILGFLILVGRLIELQIIKGPYYRSLSEGNRIRKVTVKAPRGRILARGGEVLVDNKEVLKKLVFSPDSGFSKSDDLTGANTDELIKEPMRYYPLGEKFAHVGGYLGEVNEKEVGKVNPRCPEKGPRKADDLVGRSGLEEEYECHLSGADGEELIEVNTLGKKVRVLGRREAVPGKDLKTWISFALQEKVAEAMADKKGAAIVSDPNGQILALYSAPSFDPNWFIDKRYSEKVSSLLTDEDFPLFNRAIGGQFHPGSVFKPVVAVAALTEGAIDEAYTYTDSGVITIDKYSYTNWYFTQYGGTEGTIGLKRAIARSTDTFFYKVGELTGIDDLVKWTEKFGFDKETKIDLPGEIAGLVPSPTWKKKVKNEIWFLGNTYHFSIGQGDLSITPIEENQAISAIASAGELCSPKIATETKCNNLGIDKKTLEIIKQGMIDACSTGGTGYSFFGFSPQVACKTGTAETNVDGKTHAWFTVFAPSDFPDIVATVLVERGGEGSKVAGPVAKDIFDFWFSKSHE